MHEVWTAPVHNDLLLVQDTQSRNGTARSLCRRILHGSQAALLCHELNRETAQWLLVQQAMCSGLPLHRRACVCLPGASTSFCGTISVSCSTDRGCPAVSQCKGRPGCDKRVRLQWKRD